MTVFKSLMECLSPQFRLLNLMLQSDIMLCMAGLTVQ